MHMMKVVSVHSVKSITHKKYICISIHSDMYNNKLCDMYNLPIIKVVSVHTVKSVTHSQITYAYRYILICIIADYM